MICGLAILDIGATLVTGPADGPAARIAAHADLDVTRKGALREALMTRPFASPREVVEFVGLPDGPATRDLDRAVCDVWAAQQHESQPIAGAMSALRDLHKRGFQIAVVSNIWQPYLDSVREHLGAFLDAHVAPELQLFSFREGQAKPALELFRRALQRTGVDPTAAVMIGDSYAEDIAPAAMLGISTIWVLHRPQRELGNLTRVLNGEAPAPSHTIGAIGELTGALAASTLVPPPGPVHAS